MLPRNQELATPAVAQLLKHCRIAVPKAPKTAAPKAKEPKPAKKPAAAKAAPKK